MVIDQIEMNQLRENNVDENVPITKRNDGKKSSECNQSILCDRQFEETLEDAQ